MQQKPDFEYKLVRDGIDYLLIQREDDGNERIMASTSSEHWEYAVGKLTVDEILRTWLSSKTSQDRADQVFPPEEWDEKQAVRQVISRRAYAQGYQAALKNILLEYEWPVEINRVDSSNFQITKFL